MSSLTPLQRYGIAVLGVILAAILRLALNPLLGADLPLFFFLFAIIFAGWFGGLGPGLVCTALSVVVGDYLFLEPRGAVFPLENELNMTRAFALILGGTGVSILFDRIQRAIKAQLECLERFRILIESARDHAIFTLDSAGRVACWNAGAEQIEGYREREIVGQSYSIFYTQEDVERDKPRTDLEAAASKGRHEEEGWRMRKDGSRFWASGVIAPLRDFEGRLQGFVKITRDITERKLADEALRESEERFAKAFKASPDALVISRIADGVILETNDSFVAMSGYNRDELIGRSPSVLGLYADPSDRQRALAMLKERNFVRNFEFRMKRRSGEVRFILLSAEPLELHGEHCWLTIGRDITERKQAEEEREQLLLKERAAREEAETANRMKDEFLATMSHELRTPLTTIMGWAHLLESGSLSESQSRHAVQVISQSAKSQAALVNDILDVSRMVAGRFKLDIRPAEIAPVLMAAIDVIRPTADAKGIHLREVIEDRNSTVQGDAARLQQVFWNLLSNAVKFTSQGGFVEARLTRSDNEVEISIADSGIGMDPDLVPHIFDRFRQADSTSTRRYGGLGLGLAIVRHVVEMHGGSVAASSPGKGRGATLTVRLPAVASPQSLQQRRAPPESPDHTPAQSAHREGQQRLSGLQLLVVEDDPDTLGMLRLIFEENGAKVATASSTTEALELLERLRPDALISDLAMPGQDGFDLIRQMRSREPGKKIPAVALSAYTRPEDRTRALGAGFQVHVSKPVNPDELIDIVANLTATLHS